VRLYKAGWVVSVLAFALTGCGNDGQAARATSPSAAPSAPSDPSPSEPDACELLSADEVADLAGKRVVGPAEPRLVGGLPVCKWPVEDDGFVQVGSLSAADWAQGLPQLLRMMEDAGLVEDADGKRQFQQMRDLVETNETLTPTEACAAFSTMLELQGQPVGTQVMVNVIPNNEAPIGMAGQMCSAGRFTTVTVANEAGLTKPLPGQKVVSALKLVHRRGLG